MKGKLTQVGKGKGSHKCPSQIWKCLIIQALKRLAFLPPISFLFSFFPLYEQMTTIYFTRWICSEGIVTDAILPGKTTFRLPTQILSQNQYLPICRHSPVRVWLLKPTGWLTFVALFQTFFTHLDLMAALFEHSPVHLQNSSHIHSAKIPYPY